MSKLNQKEKQGTDLFCCEYVFCVSLLYISDLIDMTLSHIQPELD